MEPRGIAPRSTQCHCVVLLLDDGPEMERAPGLAPGKSGFASRRLDDFGIARVLKWGGRRVLPPLGDLHRIECWLLHHGLHLKVIRLRVPPRLVSLTRRVHELLCQTGIKEAEAGGHAPHSAYAGRSAFEAVPARLSGSASMKMVSRHGAAPCSAV